MSALTKTKTNYHQHHPRVRRNDNTVLFFKIYFEWTCVACGGPQWRAAGAIFCGIMEHVSSHMRLLLRQSYILMFKVAQHFEFAENSLRGYQRLKYVGQFLEGHPTPVAWICNSPEYVEVGEREREGRENKNSEHVCMQCDVEDVVSVRLYIKCYTTHASRMTVTTTSRRRTRSTK